MRGFMLWDSLVEGNAMNSFNNCGWLAWSEWVCERMRFSFLSSDTQGRAPSRAAQWRAVLVSNWLNHEGRQPFHMEFLPKRPPV
jgi:hypothetical protein